MSEEMRIWIQIFFALAVFIGVEYAVWRNVKQIILELNIDLTKEKEKKVKRLVFSVCTTLITGSYLYSLIFRK